MMQTNIPNAWTIQNLPPHMTRNYEFGSYAEMRKFLDDLADLSEKKGYYPNLNFSRTHVKVNIDTEDKDLGENEYDFATDVDALLEA